MVAGARARMRLIVDVKSMVADIEMCRLSIDRSWYDVVWW